MSNLIILFPRRFAKSRIQISAPEFGTDGVLVKAPQFREQTPAEYAAQRGDLTDKRVSIIAPSPDCILQYGIEAIAQKDVPHGAPFRIADRGEVPAERDAWRLEDATYADGIGAEGQEFDLGEVGNSGAPL